MASAGGKKGKKSKGTVISLQSFLADGEAPSGTTQVAKKIRNVDGEESDEGGHSLPLVYQLPTAPRAKRIFDDDIIPHKPPYIAYITNLPFDVTEDDVYVYFEGTQIASLRLPREDGETGRVRGFGYIEFENRDDLIHVLSLPDPSLKGRRIRIEISNENEQYNTRQKSSRRGFEAFGNSSERESTNWRLDSAHNNVYEKGYNRDRKPAHEDSGVPGSWRLGNRPKVDFAPNSERNIEEDRDFKTRGRSFDRAVREKPSNNDDYTERPKLNLKPRTLPLPEIVTKPENDFLTMKPEVKFTEDMSKNIKSGGVLSEKVFGSAKPVDTAAREVEIEERLEESRRQDRIRMEIEQANVSTKLSEIHLEKTDKENTNSAISWRCKNDYEPGKISELKRISPDRKTCYREKGQNRYIKSREKHERNDNFKPKRDLKMDRSTPKAHSNQAEPILQSSNKYFGLDDEASE